MATHSSTLAWKNPMDRGAWWAAVYEVAQSQTQLKQLSSSSINLNDYKIHLYLENIFSFLKVSNLMKEQDKWSI